MRSALTIARLELNRRMRDRSMLVQGIAAPLIMAAIIGFAFGGGFSFEATIGLADADGSEVTRAMVDQMTAAQPDDSPISFVAVDPIEAEVEVTQGVVDAVIVLPSGLATSQTTDSLQVIYDPAKQTTADVATSIAQRIAAQVRASQIAVSAAIATGPQPPTDEAIEADVAAVSKLEIPLTIDQQDAGKAYSPVAYFAPAMAMLFLFFGIGSGARSLMEERKQGTLQRVRAAPISDLSILLGKSAGVLVAGLAGLVVIWGTTTVVFGADWGDPVAVLAVIVGVVCAIAGLSILVTGLARTEAQAEGLTSILAFGLALLGGSFIQPGAMPEVLETLSVYTPNGLALQAFTLIGAADATLGDVAWSVALLVVGGLLVGAIGLVLLRKKATT